MAIAYWKGRHSFIKKLYATKIIVLGKPLCEQEFRSTFVAPEKWTVNDLVNPSVVFDAPKYYICDDPVYFNDLVSINFIDKKVLARSFKKVLKSSNVNLWEWRYVIRAKES